jgi:dienelactone hydrolase
MTRRTLLAAAAAQQAAPPKRRSGYIDWSWETWQEITGESRPSLVTAQSGAAALSDLTKLSREELRRVIDIFVGPAPATRPPLEATVLDEVKLDGGALIRRKLRYQSEPGEFIPAYLFVPAARTAPGPAVICPHQTVPFGKDEPAGLAGNPRLHMALALARRGYITLTYDAACFGERHNPATGHYGEAIPFYRAHPRWSMMGKMAWDLSRSVDYLSTLPLVDPARIGSIGHSHGGYTTWSAMALDDRLAAGVSSCGYDTFRHDGNPYRWSHATALLPRLGFYVSSPYIDMRNYSGVPDSETIRIPFDLHWPLALIAPRPLMLTASDDDNIFPNAGWSTRQTEARLRPLYERANAPGRFETFYFRGGHGFPPAAEQQAFAFLDRFLK